MRVSKLVVALAAMGVLGSAHAVNVLTENFDNVAGLSASGWVFTNNSTSADQAWGQGNSGIFTAASGAANSYVAANFLSTASGAVSNWLISPVMTLDASSVLSFLVRAAGEGFLDTVEVRLSLGTGSDVGTTTASLGTFTTLLGSYSAITDTGWLSQSYALGLTGTTTGRIAFHYVVADVATAGNYVGIDSVNVTAVPEPATYALMGLGVAALLLRRRVGA